MSLTKLSLAGKIVTLFLQCGVKPEPETWILKYISNTKTSILKRPGFKLRVMSKENSYIDGMLSCFEYFAARLAIGT
jgi:hypothetical protein